MSRRQLWLILVFSATVRAEAGQRMHVTFDAAGGKVRAAFFTPEGVEGDVLRLPAIELNGRSQTGFQPLTGAAGPGGFANDLLTFRIEPIGPMSAALVWSTRDGAPADFLIPIADNSAYFGGGERFNGLNQKGYILPMASIDRPEEKGVVSYKPVPYYMSTRGYAVWVDSAAPGTFDFNATDRERVLLRFRAARLRLVLIRGPDFAAMLAEFTRLTGRPRLPPAWAFAPWKSRNIHHNRDEVLADAELARRHDLPGSVIVIDSPWQTGYNDFVLNERQFRNPKAMFARLRELGFHVCLWLTPFINVENQQDMPGITPGPSRNFDEAKRRGFLVKRPDGEPMIAEWWKGRGGLVDFTNPQAVTWWHDQIDQARHWGLRALKCDDGEGNFVQDAVFADGTPAAEMRNRYAALYLRAAQAYIDERLGGDGVLFARCGFTGTQAQPFCWAGDNEASFSFDNGLPSVVLAGQNAALSGLAFWGHDIAGYIGTPSKELFIRWTQFGAFSPLMQVHMTSNLGPWDFDAETLAIYRSFAKLHTALFPYIYDAAHEAAASGMPIIRPMVLAFPGDTEAWPHRYQYLFGPDLLVAPMVQPGTRRSVYLPRLDDGALWVDYWSGRTHAGGQVIEVEAPLARMPLFVRGGALICMLPDEIDTLVTRRAGMASDVVTVDERRVLQVWPGPGRTYGTHDGLEARLTHADGKAILALAADPPRTVELWRMHPTRGTTTRPVAGGDTWALDPETGHLRMTLRAGPLTALVAWTEG